MTADRERYIHIPVSYILYCLTDSGGETVDQSSMQSNGLYLLSGVAQPTG